MADLDLAKINAAVEQWRQGDYFLAPELFFIHLADLQVPLSTEADEIAKERLDEGAPLDVEGVASAVAGYVVLTQTCDIVRDCSKRPYVEVCPLVEVPEASLREVQYLRRPAFAFVPALAARRLVADLDRIVTIEKSLLARWSATLGCRDDSERRAFAEALARHRARPAFPNDFNDAMRPLQEYLRKMHSKSTDEGALLRSIGEIRVSASPDWWAEESINVFLWFILDPRMPPPNIDRSVYVDVWLGLFDQTGKYQIAGVICHLDDLKATDYVYSDRLDLDALSAR